MSNTWRAILVLTAFFALAPQADAGVITILNNRALFNTLADPNVLLTFDKIEPLPDAILTYPDGSPRPVSCHFTCDYIVDDSLVLASANGYFAEVYGGDATFGPYGSTLFTSIIYPAPLMTAIGFDLTGTGLLSFSFGRYGLTTTDHYLLNVTSPTFLGFISDSPFDYFSLAGPISDSPFDPNDPTNWQTATLDNLAIRTVPEPSTVMLFVTGFALLKVVRLRRKNRSVFPEPE